MMPADRMISYVTIDVFTDRIFGGNPLAVVLDAEQLSSAQMQTIAREFNYSETTFVLPPRDSCNTAHVRIFTPRVEVPFAGHPNVGTAVVLAKQLEAKGLIVADMFRFEEAAGIVAVRLLRQDGAIIGAELGAPQALSTGATVSADDAADCLSLTSDKIGLAVHAPQVLSVGLPFLVAEVISRDALRAAKPNLAAHERILPAVGTDAIFAYSRASSTNEIHARVFAPLDGCTEDPATGSATAACIAMLASVRPERDAVLSWRVQQGVDMGRPSLLLGRTEKRDGIVSGVHVAGHAVVVMHGFLHIPAQPTT